MLEDSPLDVAVIQKMLGQTPFQFEFTVTKNGKDYTEKLSHYDYDVILCDYQLPDFDASQALRVRNQKNSSVPFILITGAVSEEQAIAILREGANDYILKDRLQRLPVAVEKAVKKRQLLFDKESLEISLSELTERFQLAAQTSFDVIWDYDLGKNSVYCSDAIEKIIGKPVKGKLDPCFLKGFIFEDDLELTEKNFLRAIKSTEHRWRKIFRMVRADGTIVWVNTNAFILRNKQERAIRVVGVMHDITEVRKLQHELLEQELQNQREITKAIVEAQEKERTEIGKELHDNVNQLLATAKIMIDTARNVPDMRDVCLVKSQESILEAINELRNLAHSMIPPPFEKNDFEQVLNDLLFKLRLTGKLNIEHSLPSSSELQRIDNPVKLALYRIIQEQLSNILKHARACNVLIAIETGNDFVSMVIKDDGVGFDPKKKSGGIGLKNMENRCGLFGGAMSLHTSPAMGCEIKIRIPLKTVAALDFNFSQSDENC
jgi:two-component system sensor histidine kinase UhpB